ncbi:ferric reductase-like transmembrane domain-containing protein [Patulibacter minatonensis]|uniref:ferric reductase-like transmembrane domain-containing protein n=1 Tax=Patulibacter minatonensis TaxID=298163 RepID=UPI000A05B0C5|nr:ferric reductase-like transmembrane domain-containing protein [Patulibacter minatonensis]
MTLWYLSRATGAVTLVLLTLTIALGIANERRWAPRRTPRFVVDHLHRSTSLLVLVVLAIHIATNVIDGYVQIDLVDAVVPFVGSYHPLWLGLGTLAFDLLIAVIVTSVLRDRIGVRAWRAVHWATYVCWPVAMAHGLGIGTDVGTTGWMLWLSVACAATVAAAVWARLTLAPRPVAAPLAPTVPAGTAMPAGTPRSAGTAMPFAGRETVPLGPPLVPVPPAPFTSHDREVRR